MIQNAEQEQSDLEVAIDPPMVNAADISVVFGGIHALIHVSLAFPSGQRCGIVGPNGAGKTTLLDVLSGVRSPSSGKVTFLEHDVARSGPTKIAHLGLRRTFQRQQPFGWLSVEDNVLVALEWRKRNRRVFADLVAWPGQRHREELAMLQVTEALAQCGLLEVRKEIAANLPIGQVRLLELARAIVDRPRFLLLDEPTSGLSQYDSSRMGGVLEEFAEDPAVSFVLVEHDIEFVTRHCDRLVVLDQGSVLADGEPSAVVQDPSVIEAYIGSQAETGSQG